MSGAVEVAVGAFLAVERVEFLLEKKKRELSEAIVRVPPDDMTEYMKRTEKIMADYEDRREKAGL